MDAMTRHVLGTALLVFACACRKEPPLDIDTQLAALCAVPPTGLAIVDTEGLVSLALPPKAMPAAMTITLSADGVTLDGAKIADWPKQDGMFTALMERRRAALAEAGETGEAAKEEPAKEEPAKEEPAKAEPPAKGEEPAAGEEPEKEAKPKFSAPVNLLIGETASTEQIAAMLSLLETVGFDQAFLPAKPGGEVKAPPAPDQALASELLASMQKASSAEARQKVLADALAAETASCEAVAAVFRDVAADDPAAQCTAMKEGLPAAFGSCEGQVDPRRVLTIGQMQLIPVGPVSGLALQLSPRGGFVSVPKAWTWADLAPRVVEYDGKPFRILAE